MHFHLIGVCGTGMGALAGLLKAAGHRVTGSDSAFDAPMGPALKSWGIETMHGPDPANLEPAPDIVVVGNVCRPTHVEAKAALEAGLDCRSFPAVMHEFFLSQRRSLVMAGTHGKTTSTSLLSFLLRETHQDPGFLVGGIAKDFDTSFRLGAADGPFVIEGDEYDCAFFEKSPKFWQYNPYGVLLTSIEHDHIDIYPTEQSYLDAFRGLVERIPPEGIVVAYAGDADVRAVMKDAQCRVRYYALDDDDCGDATPIWSASMAPTVGGATPLDLYGGGTFLGRVMSPLSGRHNARNVLGVLALAAEGVQADVRSLMDALPRFGGVKRRQDLLAVAGGIRIYDDFAHHPTAVGETLRGLRGVHRKGRLVAVYEPRSATAARNLHQTEYVEAFAPSDVAIIAPVGRDIPLSEKLDTNALAEAMRERGKEAHAPADHDAVVALLREVARDGDTVVLMSNGTFGGLHDRVIAALTPMEPLS